MPTAIPIFAAKGKLLGAAVVEGRVSDRLLEVGEDDADTFSVLVDVVETAADNAVDAEVITDDVVVAAEDVAC